MGLLDTGYVGPKKRGSGKGLLDAPSAKAEELAAALAEAIAPASMRETQAKRMAAIDRRDLRGLLAVESGAVDNALAGLGGMAPLGIFAGAKAKTADMVKLAKAQEMAKAGADPLDVWRSTGWTDQFPDRKWRFEIDDSLSELLKGNGTKEKRLNIDDAYLAPDILKHDEFYKAYPDARSIDVYPDVGRKAGSASYHDDIIDLGVSEYGSTFAKGRSTMLHELQHAIQQREGFARGGSPDFFASGPMFDNRARELAADLSEALTGGITAKPEEIFTAMKYAAPEDVAPIIKKYGFDNVDDAVKFLKNEDCKRTPQGQYERLAGEAEARLVQQRMNLTPEQRAAVAPWQQFDVPREQQIVRGLESGSIRPELLPWLIGLGAGGMYGLKKAGLLGGDD